MRQTSHAEAHAADDAGHDDHHTPLEGVPRGKATLVTSDGKLAEAAAACRAAGTFAYDTEFVGEMSYRPQLCLVQLATHDHVWLIDPLAGVDLGPVWAMMVDPALHKLVHAGEQDLEHVWQHAGTAPTNVVDTQVAGGFVGLGYPASLSKLVLELSGVRLAKGFTFTDWTQRPLSASQMKYAADDVRYLPAIGKRLAERLGPRMAWVVEECDARSVAAGPDDDPDALWQRVRGSAGLDARSTEIVKRLATWREQAAREADVPARSYLKDEVLVGLSKFAPKTKEKLAETKHLPRPVVEHHGQHLLDLIAAGAAAAAGDKSPRPLPQEPTLSEKARGDAAWIAAQALCVGQQLDPALVTSRSEVVEVERAVSEGSEPTTRLLTGWRREAVGERLVALLRGGAITLGWRDGRPGLVPSPGTPGEG